MRLALGVPTVPPRASRGESAEAASVAAPAASAPRPVVAVRPAAEPRLLDRYGRVADDLRISLTDRCNLRCGYCMPAEGLAWAAPETQLSADEIVRLARVAVERLGVRSIRLTGGEPLLRADLVEIVRALAALDPRPELALTTNAVGLASRAAALREAGLDRLNVSLDSVRHDTFAAITRRPFLEQALAGIAAADAAGFTGTKINAVLLPGVNDDEAPELLAWALAAGHELRVIEQMPLDAGRSWNREAMVTAAAIRARLSEHYRLEPVAAPRDGAPAERFTVHALGATPSGAPASPAAASAGASRAAASADTDPTADPEPQTHPGAALGTVGIVASVTEPFCGDCRRTRLTADGRVRSCLFSHAETDLRGLLRAGAEDEAIADAWRAAMWRKPAAHGRDRIDPVTGSGIDAAGFQQPARPMSAIGG